MNAIIKRVFTFILCVTLLMGSNAMQAFCAEIGAGDFDGIVDEGTAFSDEETSEEDFSDDIIYVDVSADEDVSAGEDETRNEDLDEEESFCEDEIGDVYGYSYDEAKLMFNSGDTLPYSFNYESNGEGTCAITGITGTVCRDLIIPETIDGMIVTEIRKLGQPNKTLWHGKLYVPATVKTIESKLFDVQCFDEVYIGFSDENNNYFSSSRNTHKVTNIGNETITLFKIDGNTWNNATTGDRDITTLAPGETALAGDYEELKYFYEVVSESDKTIRLTGYNWLMPKYLTLPEEVDGYKVVALGDTLFQNILSESYSQVARYLENVVIPATVTEISEESFTNCISIKRVINRSNASVKLPTVVGHDFRLDSDPDSESSVTVIPAGQTAFRNDSYKLVYEDKEDGSLVIKGIDGDATGYLNIPSMINGKKVTEIAKNAFSSKKSLFGDIILPETITTIHGSSFLSCSGFDGELYIPKNLVVEGENTAPFKFIYNISKLTIEEGTTTIYSNEFNGIKCVKELNIPESVTEIRDRGFAGFSSLEGELVIPENVNYIGKNAFMNVTANSVKFEGPVETIESNAFSGCFNLTEIEFPEGLHTLGDLVLDECTNLEIIVLPKTLEEGIPDPSSVTLWKDSNMKVKDLINKGLIPVICSGNSMLEEQSGGGLADRLYPGGRAYNEQFGNRFNYSVISDKQRTACITGYKHKAIGDLEIPAYVDGYVVVGIGSKAFKGCDGFDGEIYIHEYVKDIAADAFSDCSNIKRVVNNSSGIVTLPQSSDHSWSDENQGTKNLKTLMPGHVAVREDYDGFKLTYEVISESDKTIRITGYEFGQEITGGESLINYEIPEKINGYIVTEIGANAFSGEAMRGFLLIPQTVTYVSDNAFEGCKNINRIRNRSSVRVKLPLEDGYTWTDITTGVSEAANTEELEPKHIACRSDLDVMYPTKNAMPYYEYSIISEAENTARFYGMPYENYTRAPYIPPTVDGYKVVEIGSQTFRDSGNFKVCNLEGCLAIPEGVTAVFEFAFYETKGINALYLPSSLKYIDPRTFSALGIEHLVIPEGVENISYYAFCGSPLKTVELPDSLKFCDVSAMRKRGDSSIISEDCTAEVVYPSDCKPYDKGPLEYAPEGIVYYDPEDDLTNGVYIFREGIEVVPSYFFYETSENKLKEVEIPESVKIIGRSAFYGCSNLKRITIPEGVTTIASYAFHESNLTRLDIPASVKSFGQRIIKNDGNLKNITFYGSVSVGQYYSYGTLMEIVMNTPDSITNMGDEPLDLLFVLGTGYNTANLVDFEDREKSVGRFLEPGHTAISTNYVDEDFTYETVSAEDKTVKITGYIGEDTEEIYIPNHILHYHVVDIAEDAFASIENIPKVENASDAVAILPVIEGKTWVDAQTGESIKEVKNGQKAVWKELCESGIVYSGLEEEGYTYTGSAIKPEITVCDGGVKLKEKTDYTIAYKNNTKAYTLKEGDEGFNAKLAPCIIITSKGNYSGKETIYFTINPKDISNEDVSVDFAQIFESSKYVAPVPTVTYDGKKLANNKDFTVEYYTNEECNEKATPKTAGTYFAKIIAKGSNFTGEKKVEFVVLPSTLKSVSKLKISVPKSVTYTGEALKPEVKVSDGKTILKVVIKGETEQSDCDVYVSFENNTEIGTAKVCIEGSGVKYVGSKEVTFKITGMDIKKAKVSGITKTFTYDGTEKKQPEDTILTYSPKKGVTENLKWIDKAEYDLIEDPAEKKTYNAYVIYEKNVNVGTATMVFTGVNNFAGTLKTKYKISDYDILADAEGKMSVRTDASYAYSKAGVKPLPQVTFDGKALVNGKDYKLSYSNNNVISALSKKVPTIKITGIGNFKGKMNQTFAIVPKNLASKSVSILVSDKVWSSKAGNWKTSITVTDEGKKLSAGKDYDKNIRYTYVSIPEGGVIYDGASKAKVKPAITRTKGEKVGDKDIVPAGTVIEAEVTGIGNYYYDGKSVTYRIAARNLADKKIKVKVASQMYTGQAIKISKSDISFSGKNIGEVTYEIDKSSYKNNVNKGKATVVIKGTGNYCGTKTVTFSIKQKIFKWW